MSMKLHPVILCGGSGTRLWPMSREHYPKQLLRLVGEDSLLQATLRRLQGLQPGEGFALADPLLISNEAHRFLVAEQMRQAGLDGAGIILEPVGRNTAPAVTLAAEQVVREADDGLLLVMPADHVIADRAAFHRAVCQGLPFAAAGKMVTFGIVPTHAETGYGYIKRGQALGGEAHGIERFVEKPDADTAAEFVSSGDYLWNSGMFLFRASAWLEAIAEYRPDIARQGKAAMDGLSRDLDFIRVDAQAFARCPSDSIDYAVMEQVTSLHPEARHQGVVIPLDAGWSDVGSWQSLWEVGDKNAQGNVVAGDVYLHDTQDSLVLAERRVVATIGLRDMVVIETPDAVLVADKAAAQDVKQVVGRLKDDARQEAVSHRRVYRPWGSYEGIDVGERFQVKRIVVAPGARLSLQMHHHRAEHWIVVRGTARVTRGEEQFLLSENQSTYIPLGTTHRLENPGTIPLEIIEVQSGSYLGEDDIVRLDDQYGRD